MHVSIWHDAWSISERSPKASDKEKTTMNPIATGVAAAVISGVAMYSVGANAAQLEALTQNPALVQAAGNAFVPATDTTVLRPVASPSATTVRPIRNTRRATVPSRTAARTVPVQEREIVREEDYQEDRSWGKTAMVIGGSAASGAGVGGIVGGKKGALIGAAIGGGAASIYEATQRK
jgi:hypothetical protein